MLKSIFQQPKVLMATAAAAVSVLGSYFMYKHVKDMLEVDKIASRILSTGMSVLASEQELNGKDSTSIQILGRLQVIRIFSESKQLIRDRIRLERREREKIARALIDEHELSQYASVTLKSVVEIMNLEQSSIDRVCECIGLSAETLAMNVKYYNENLQPGRIGFFEELKDAMIQAEVEYYFNESSSTANTNSIRKSDVMQKELGSEGQQNEQYVIQQVHVRNMYLNDYLTFKAFLTSDAYTGIIGNNRGVFAGVIFALIDEQKCQDTSEILAVLMNLAYDLLEKHTGHSEASIKSAYRMFGELLRSNNEIGIFQTLEKNVTSFIRKNLPSLQKNTQSK